MTSYRAVLAGVVAALVACGPPIGVKRLGAGAVHRELTGSVLSTGTLSTATRIELQKRGLAERFEKEPATVLAELHRELAKSPTEADLLSALAELSFTHAMQGGGRQYYLAATLYAWDYLFAPNAEQRLDALDPRGRLCANLYNVGLARAFESERPDGRVVLEAGTRKLPFGALDVAFDPESLRWGDRRLVDLVSASELAVSGLRNRYRQWGIGAPLNASTERLAGVDPAYDFVFPRVKVPVTLLLRPERPGGTAESTRLLARLELFAATRQHTVDIEGRSVPLEYEPTSALADMLATAPVWEMGLGAFFSGAYVSRQPTRLGGLQPYSPDRIPVVLVHGTASNPAYWSEMVNDLVNDPRVRDRYQLWAFWYDTANPVLYSAMTLREALTDAARRFDPTDTDACMKQMVLIGHSQGGLLIKLTAVESGDRFWRNLSSKPFEEADFAPQTRDLLRRVMFVSPLPFVRDLIFIATPHRGSYRAGRFARALLQRLVSFPADLARAGSDLVTGADTGRLAMAMGRIPNSVDNMAPGSPFLQVSASLPVAPGVSTHSVIAVQGDGPVEEGKDGVVAYSSAHIEPVDSELVVRSGHSCQGNPHTIEEVRRILLEHADAVFEGGTCRAPERAAP